MISDNDRSGYFGASDTHILLGNTKTKTFEKWWLEKLGIYKNNICTGAMLAGTHYEHRILEAIGVSSFDKQFIIEDLKLRVNLDGDKDGVIYECKTFKNENGFKMPKRYKEQVQVQMFGCGFRKAVIVAYGLVPEDYDNYFNKIKEERIQTFDIEYDESWVKNIYLPRLRYMAECLDAGMFPDVNRSVGV